MSPEDNPDESVSGKHRKGKPVVKPKRSKKTTTEEPAAQLIEQKNRQAISKLSQQEFFQQKRKLKDVSHLASIAEEYLSSFALIGYSLQDEKVVVLNMPTSKDEAALVDLIRATFVDLASNRP